MEEGIWGEGGRGVWRPGRSPGLRAEDLETGTAVRTEGGGVGVAKKFLGRELSLDEKVQMVEKNRDRYGLNCCLEALSVAKSSWHYRHHGYGRPRAKEEEIEREMRQILKDHPDYGRPRMTVELWERLSYRVNSKRVERLLRDNGWGMIRHFPRRSKSGVQKILHHRRGNLNKVSGREFGVLKAFSTDFTELRYAQGRRKAWLMTLSDRESRWAAGWWVEPRRNLSLALRCWERAKERIVQLGGEVSGILVHHDQDPVFTSYAWIQQLMIEDGVEISFSENGARGNPWIESLWGRMKVETESLIHQAETFEELKRVIDERFEYYNRRRRHSSIGHQRPEEYAKDKLKTGENIDP